MSVLQTRTVCSTPHRSWAVGQGAAGPRGRNNTLGGRLAVAHLARGLGGRRSDELSEAVVLWLTFLAPHPRSLHQTW